MISVQCECGEWSSELCPWSGPAAGTVTVDVMPGYLRASHEAANNSGVYPHNGAMRLRVARACAVFMADMDGVWVEVL